MVVYFGNNGSYGQSAVGIPVLADGVPIGFVSEVNEENVICYIWDRFVCREQIGMNLLSKEQDIHSIEILTPSNFCHRKVKIGDAHDTI